MILNQYEEIILDLNNQPVSNRFLHHNEENNVPSFAMELVLDKSTGIIKLKDPFPIEELKPHYDWLTCFEPEDHLDSLVEKIIKLQTNDISFFILLSFIIYFVILIYKSETLLL